MSYCNSCGAYIPDWADECPACGQPKDGTKKSAETKKKTAGSVGGSAAASAGEEKSGEYHYSYKKQEAGRSSDKGSGTRSRGGAEKRWSGAANGRNADRGTFTYGDEGGESDPGTFRYDGGEAGSDYYEPRRTSRDYESDYKSDAQRNELFAALCYFGPMFILSWILKPKSRFVKYHVNQGLVFFLMCVIINIFDFIPFVGLLNIFSVVCFICGLSNAFKGKRKPLPGIGEITLIN